MNRTKSLANQVVQNLIVICSFNLALSSVEADPAKSTESTASTFVTESEVVAIGDIHGDIMPLISLLNGNRLVDANGRWIGGTKHLIFMGDLLDRGPNSREIFDWIMELETQAAAAGGRVTTLLGNHELMVMDGDLRYTTKEEEASFREFGGILGAVKTSSKYGRWFASRNSVVKINRILYVHAGVELWPSTDLQEINDAVRGYIRNKQWKGPPIPSSQQWIFGDTGPFWTRKMATETMTESEFEDALRIFDVDRIVVGHTQTESGRIETRYRDRLVLIDSGMSSYAGGKAVSLSVNGTKIQPSEPMRRTSRRSRLFRKLQERTYGTCQAMGSAL